MNEQNSPAPASIVHRVRVGNHDVAAQSKLQRFMVEAIALSETRENAITRLLDIVRQQYPNAILAYFHRDASEQLIWNDSDTIFEHLPLGASEAVRALADETCYSGDLTFRDLSGADLWWVLTVPVIRQGLAPEVVCAAIKKSDGNRTGLIGALQLAASHLTLFDILKSERRERLEAKQSADLLVLLRKLDVCDDWDKTSFVLVNELQKQFGCEQVALGIPDGEKANCRVVAVSGVSALDPRSNFAEQVAMAMNEAILRRKITVVDRDATSEEEATLAHQELLRTTRCRRIVSTPMFGDNRQPLGVFVQWDNKCETEFIQTLAFARLSQSVLDGRLQMIRRTTVHPFRKFIHKLTHAETRKKVLGVTIALGIFASVMAMPMEYRVSCDCQLEPVLRRFVASPYDGTLEESLVEAGDVVRAGQTLARMDGRELHWELSGYEADYKSEQKKRDAASARDDVAIAQQSDLEMQRLSLKMDLLRHRLENLEIKSPIDGVVIEGDLKKAEGIPLTIGQTLFEIGPLDQMIVELAVPEREILHVEPGMSVEITLDADQSNTETGTLLRITPRSEIRASESVFVAELALSNVDGKYRPGMKGSAMISGHRHPLGWNWFHHAWESFAVWIGV